ncbi:STAS domain-containing protein [Streptomyces sp. HC44]|uniref:Anti-sigma factor antagonist n=1 Tax=Streptomyces scabichelini TaxID=2711217 RepID=A0A6G4VIE1_9ACTN|nr:STAS domain-containing protein [Streptomyces scabichelini]
MTGSETDVTDLHLNPIGVGDDCAVLQIAGEIDVYTAPKLREGVIDLLDKDVLHLIADLRDVDFLDSTGLGALVGSLKRLRTREGSLKLVIDSDRLLRIFRITGLVQVFSIHPSVPEAITAGGHWREAVQGACDGACDGTFEGDSDSRSIEEWCRKHGLL